MKKFVLLIVALIMTIASFAQRTVRGTVVEQDTQEAVIQATAALLKGEKVVANAVTNTEGGFTIKAPEEGSYTLQITYVGFKTYTKKITLKDGKDYAAGTIKLEPDAIMLKGATVTARAQKVTLKAEPLYIMQMPSVRPRGRWPRNSYAVCLVQRLATTVPSRSMVNR